MSIKYYTSIISIIFTLIGCASRPVSLSDAELRNVISIDYLIDEIIGFRESDIEYRPFLTFPSDKDILKPALYIRNYCTYLGGKINQSIVNLPNLERTNVNFDSNDENYIFDEIVQSFGRFECKEETNGFVVDILHSGSYYVDESARKTRVSINAISKDQLLFEKLEDENKRQRELQYLKESQRKRDLQILVAKWLFSQGQENELFIGQEVCSIKNQIGFVENITEKKVKILLFGYVKNEVDYALFSDRKIYINQLNQTYIWDDKNNWSNCKLKMGD